MESCSCEAILCISCCVLIGGMIAFIAFSIWKMESMNDVKALPRQIERRKDPFWESHKEADAIIFTREGKKKEQPSNGQCTVGVAIRVRCTAD